MITTKEQLNEYIAKDLKRNGLNGGGKARLILLIDKRLRFHVVLRKLEYYHNTQGNNPFKKLMALWYGYRRYKLGVELGYSIRPNCIGEGMRLAHYGSIVINESVKIGRNAVIHSCVNIAEETIIGDNVYIGPGAKIFGHLRIGDNVSIGANAVVNKSFTEDNIVIAGVPAKIVKYKR